MHITSAIIGQLNQSDLFNDWWKSRPIPIPFFDNEKLEITFMDCEPDLDKDFISKADEALKNFFNLDKNYRLNISNLIYKNYSDFVAAVDPDEINPIVKNITNETDIWTFIHPSEIYVTRRHYKEKDMYVQIGCSCDWEEEHGLQLVFRQGKKITRVSSQDGHLTEADAYDKPDEEDELLSKF